MNNHIEFYATTLLIQDGDLGIHGPQVELNLDQLQDDFIVSCIAFNQDLPHEGLHVPTYINGSELFHVLYVATYNVWDPYFHLHVDIFIKGDTALNADAFLHLG